MSFPEYLASWLNRYPFDQGWADDDANFACRRSEAAWLLSLRPKRGLAAQDDMEQLVRWKFEWRAAQILPLAAVTGDQYRHTAEVVKNAITYAADHSDDDASAMNAICSIKGFGVPMASVFLALCFPDRFTIADSRARRTLRERCGYPAGPQSFTRDDWPPYLAACRKILDECRASGVLPRLEGEWTLRSVDQALWAANGARTLPCCPCPRP